MTEVLEGDNMGWFERRMITSMARTSKADYKYSGQQWTFKHFLTITLTAAVWLACMGAAVGAIWSAALSRPVDSGALWGCVGSVIFALVMSPAYSSRWASASGFAMMMPGLYVITGGIGLIVWLVRWLT